MAGPAGNSWVQSWGERQYSKCTQQNGSRRFVLVVKGVAELLEEQFSSQKTQATVVRTLLDLRSLTTSLQLVTVPEVPICSDFLFSFFPVLHCIFFPLFFYFSYRKLLFPAVQIPPLPKIHSLQKSLNHCLLPSSAQLLFVLESRFEPPCHISSSMPLTFLATVKSVSPGTFFKNKRG